MDGEHNNASMTDGALADKLSEVLADPARLAHLAKMASSLAGSGLLDGIAGTVPEGDARSSAEQAIPRDADAQAGLPPPEVIGRATPRVDSGNRLPPITGRHAALLKALKPYLGEQKRERVDRMLQLLQLADIAGTVLTTKEGR